MGEGEWVEFLEGLIFFNLNIMKYIKFEIKKFKGVNNLVLDFEKLPNGKIFPLVGLNESGKTTILEAINLFQNRIENGNEHEMIHKNKKANFNGNIEIKAILKLEDADKKNIESFLKDKKLEAEKEIDEISITKKYEFKDSKFINKGFSSLWHVPLKVKTKRAQNFIDIYDKNEEWSELIAKIKEELIPKILYFENFLFDFPNKIYLENVENSESTKTEKQKEYRKILQDILSSIDESYNLNKHVLGRLKNPSDQNEESVKQIFNEMNKKLNDTIIKSWQQIFNNSTEKNIEIEYKNDTDKYFVQFKIQEGSSSFYINEMSLGFRWFFGFLLFTEFRKARQKEGGEYLFLFDEPANNLHPKSQQKLLELFKKLTDKSKIIYSTHNHYLFNPKFLLTSFVIRDKGRGKNKDGEIDLRNYSQNIEAELYKNFVAGNPKEETHFQPILDCLEYIENPFKKTNRIVFLEGKFDYYTFRWIKKYFFADKKYDFSFYPGAGVDKYENIFREYLANNKKFIAIFDADSAGKKARKCYLKNVSEELKDNIFTLEDIADKFSGFQTEQIFHTLAERLRIQKLSFPNSIKYKKSEFNVAIQELLIKEDSFKLLDTTKNNFKEIFEFIQEKFKQLEK